jgi:hypothetical protein
MRNGKQSRGMRPNYKRSWKNAKKIQIKHARQLEPHEKYKFQNSHSHNLK